MNPRFLVVLAAALLPDVASASVGVSWSPPVLGARTYTNDGFSFSYFGGNGVDTYLPTLDVRLDGLDLQFHVMDLVASIVDDADIVIGVNGYLHTVEKPIVGGARAVFHPGLQLDLDLYDDDLLLQLLLAGRFGVEIGEGPGLGVYAIPDVGVVTYAGDSALLFGANMGFSVWY